MGVDPWQWSQLGVAGGVAVALGTVIAYVFRLFITAMQDGIKYARDERDSYKAEAARLHSHTEEQMRVIVVTLADVARVMSEVQQMMREREIRSAIERRASLERGYDRRDERRESDPRDARRESDGRDPRRDDDTRG